MKIRYTVRYDDWKTSIKGSYWDAEDDRFEGMDDEEIAERRANEEAEAYYDSLEREW